MNKDILVNIIRFVLLILLQGLILNNILLFGHINPVIYILFILLLPFETPKWILLLSAFLLGIFVGIFTNSSGIHAMASTLIAFVRPEIIKLLTPKREYEFGIKPSIKDLGFAWFFYYSVILISLHHICLFLLESFTFNNFWQTMAVTGGTTVFSLFLIIILQYLFPSKNKI